jgi:RNA polymerase sigma factor (sigma-70 family)
VASATPSPAHAPSPAAGTGRAAGLPRDPGRATELLYKRHGTTVFRYAWHVLGRREDAEDASQATFLAVHRALGSGTAVLEPGAWVLRIARNECLGRLRQRARVPGPSPLEDGVEPRAAGGMERLAEVRDQMRVARDTLRALPVPEREAFVLREWLGLGTAEAALTMSLTSGEIESLAGRARRSLVLAVGGLEPAVGCADTRTALEAGSLGRAGTVHLLRCPMCRGVRRALRPPEAKGVSGAIVGERLAGALPGFASGGGGIVAVLTTKAAAVPLLAKTAALVAAALVTVDVAQHEIRRVAPSHHAAAAVRARGGEAHALVLAPVKTTIARTSVARVEPAKTASAHTQVVELRAPAKPSHVRGGVASSVDHSSASRAVFTGHRDGARSSHDGSDGSSGGSDGSRHGATNSGGSGDAGHHEGGTSTATTTPTTHTSGSDDHSTGSHRSSGKQTSDGQASGSGHDGGSTTSNDSGGGGTTSGSGGTGTITAPTATTGGGDGSSPSGDHSGGSDATTSGGGGDGTPATIVTTPAVTTPPVTTTDPSVPQATGDG